MEFFKSISIEYYIYGGIGILLLGIILGFTKTIVVYRDFADLTKVFMLVLTPIGLFILLGDKVQNDIVKNVLIFVESGLLFWILITTYLDNRNIFKTLLAFITKIPLGVIFAIYLINIISPGGKTRTQRRQSRGISGIVLLFLGPILFGLVRNRVWNYKKEK
jgi:TctA family transporter